MAETRHLDVLREAIHSTPIIDNHGHNLLRLPELKTHDFLCATTEAEGAALKHHVTSLPHFRAARQLSWLYGLPSDADWDTILKKRAEILETDAEGLIRTCLAGTQTILIDDGLYGDFEAINWHNQFMQSPCKRIARIEAIAADVLQQMHEKNKLPVGVAIADEQVCAQAWVDFITEFDQSIVECLADPNVVGFKSVICYRTGLNVQIGRDVDVTEAGLRSFRKHFLPQCVQRQFRVESKGMNDALVISACKLISASFRTQGTAKPLQFHTGLGDNDIDLLESNPAVMQPLIKAFPDVPFVLLHSSYPYTREAGYLAMAYSNAWLDLGEVFPMVNRDGQEHIIRQALEITPTSKLLWSTDGHHFPETYYLANVQGKEALETVLRECVEKEDLSVDQAVKAVRDILFENSNKLYNLGIEFPGTQNLILRGATTEPAGIITAQVPTKEESLGRIRTLAKSADVQYVFIQWLDYMAQMRSRWMPLHGFMKLMTVGEGKLAISRGNLGTTPNDHMSSVADPVGSIYVEPDLESFRLLQSTGPVKGGATVMSRFVDSKAVPLGVCPRAVLGQLVHTFKQDHAIDFLVGFEIEITFCTTDPKIAPLDTSHAWGTFTDEQYMKSVALMTDIATELQNIGISIEQLHSEAGAGQYEFVLPPLPPVQAVDTLTQARQCIQQIAATKGLRATCHPMPFPGIGTAAHAHISLNHSTTSAADLEMASSSFAASILNHLPSICAITMPQPVSYNRVADDSWTGGTWVAWGTNNRETPLRRVTSNRWEIRCLDGTANMYLAVSAILAAGLDGVKRSIPLPSEDCYVNPTRLSPTEKQAMGIVKKMPRTLDEALEALEEDEGLKIMMGSELVGSWIAVKEAEQEMYGGMNETERWKALVQRY